MYDNTDADIKQRRRSSSFNYVSIYIRFLKSWKYYFFLIVSLIVWVTCSSLIDEN